MEGTPTFALIGAAGYVAPRHLRAIRANGGTLVAALDPHDSVGILDSYFPEAAFFTEFERFDRHLEKLKRAGRAVDYLVVCSPNYLHDAHCRFGLRYGAEVICEKPLVLNPWNVDALAEMEAETGGRVNTILQLRLHPSVIALRDKVLNGPPDKVYSVELTYLTARGQWYHRSWKGDEAKSGGIMTNIGIHFFDMLLWVFGGVLTSEVATRDPAYARGYLHLQRAQVNWSLGIDADLLAVSGAKAGQRTFRELIIEEEAFSFTDGFEDLHTASYAAILAGNGFGTEDVREVTALVGGLRTMTLTQI